jgi:penicillin-binding protein 1A
MKLLKRFLKILTWCMVSAMTAVLVGVMGLFFVVRHYSEDLPSTDQLANYNPPVVTRLYAENGMLLAEYAKEKRFFVPLSAIPKLVQQGFISAEDQNFYTHKGVDIYGIGRALYENAHNYGTGRTPVGGSTITQQVVKNFLLTSEKSMERKIKEAILAYRISNIYSKEKVLELYLNEIYLGQGTYGVAAAALTYFNKSLDELNSEEVALLAAMPKAPANYDPRKSYNAALERRNYVLNRMREDGYINEAEYARATKTPITLIRRNQQDTAHADYFAEEVRRRLAEMYGSEILYKGGLFVKTTVNPTLQLHADNALRYALRLYDRRHGFRGPLGQIPAAGEWQKDLKAFPTTTHVPLFEKQQLAVVLETEKSLTVGFADGTKTMIPVAEATWSKRYSRRQIVAGKEQIVSGALRAGDVVIVEPAGDTAKASLRITQVPEVNGAMVVMEPHTGRVLALSGGYAYGGPDQFNRATQAKRQPGSAFKPFVYLTALENGFNPTSIIEDGPIELSQGPGLPMWRPKNFEAKFLGPTTLRRGVEKSRNTMTVRLAVMLGIKRIQRIASRFGIYDDSMHPDFSMVLGAKETTVLKLANSYSMLVNGGRKVEASLIERIDDRNGSTIFRRDVRDCAECLVEMNTDTPPKTPPTIADDREQIIDPRVAYQMVSILEGVVQRGTAATAKSLGRPIGGKTGTTNESRDTWFVGFTPDLVIATYVGYDTPRPMGAKETGARVALPAFMQFVKTALKDKPVTEFREPAGIQKIPVNALTGQPLYAGEEAASMGIIQEAFIVGGEIIKPKSEMDAAAIEPPVHTDINPEGFAPESLMDTPFNPDTPKTVSPQPTAPAPDPGFESAPPYSTYAPIRPTAPKSESGFDPAAPTPNTRGASPAQAGTGGLY